MGKKNSVRRDIPYADRMLMEKFNTVREHRNDAARTALKIGCVALNNTEGMGYMSLVRYAVEQQRLTEAYYRDPEVEEAHLNERLTKIGFTIVDGRMLGAIDETGKPVKSTALAAAALGSAHRQELWSEWIQTTERLPKAFEPVIVCRACDGGMRVEQGQLCADGWWKVFGTRVKEIAAWRPMPEPPTIV